MGNSTGYANKKNYKNMPEISGGRRNKQHRKKITVQLEELNQKVLAKEGSFKRYGQRGKQYRENRSFQTTKEKFYQQSGGSNAKTYQQPDAKETERSWTKIWQ